MFEAAIYGHHSANTWLTWHGPKINPAFTSWWEWRADCWWRRAEGCRDAPNAFELPWVHKPKLSVFSLVSHDEINQKWYHSFLQEQAMEPQPWWVFTASWMGSFWLADQTLNPCGGGGLMVLLVHRHAVASMTTHLHTVVSSCAVLQHRSEKLFKDFGSKTTWSSPVEHFPRASVRTSLPIK